MIKYWFRKVGLPLVLAFVLGGVAAQMEHQALAFVAFLAFCWALTGARDYRVYRNARVRAEANRDARVAFRT